MSQATSVFWVSIYEHYGTFERKEVHIVSELNCHVRFNFCAAKNAVYSSATVKYTTLKQQAAFLHSLVVEANTTLRVLRLRTLHRKCPR